MAGIVLDKGRNWEALWPRLQGRVGGESDFSCKGLMGSGLETGSRLCERQVKTNGESLCDGESETSPGVRWGWSPPLPDTPDVGVVRLALLMCYHSAWTIEVLGMATPQPISTGRGEWGVGKVLHPGDRH